MQKVALVLGSGGARGIAQIGVIEVLEERGYEISAIAGCSMGAVIGGVYAAGHLSDFKEWICNLDKFGVFNLMDFTLNTQGFIKGERVFDEMKKFVEVRNIEDLTIPFTAVAVDMNKEEQFVFRNGDLFSAIRASVSIPSVLTPIVRDDLLLVDGGVMNPLPLDLVKRTDGDILLAVDLNGRGNYKPIKADYNKRKEEIDKEESKWLKAIDKMFSDFFKDKNSKKKNRRGYYKILQGSFDLIQKQLTKIMLDQHKPDVLITVPKNAADTFDFFKAEELIAFGKQKAIEMLDEHEKNQ